MPRLYSPEWVEAFNRAVAAMEVAPADGGQSMSASAGQFAVALVVEDEVTVVLAAEQGKLALFRSDPGGGEPRGSGPGGPGGPSGTDGATVPKPDVTVMLSYPDAAALSRGELDPAQALGEGRIRVRGNLGVLVAARDLLAEAAPLLAPLQASTTV